MKLPLAPLMLLVKVVGAVSCNFLYCLNFTAANPAQSALPACGFSQHEIVD